MAITADPSIIAMLKAKFPHVLDAKTRVALGVDSPAPAPAAPRAPAQRSGRAAARPVAAPGVMVQYVPSLILGAAWAISESDRRAALP